MAGLIKPQAAEGLVGGLRRAYEMLQNSLMGHEPALAKLGRVFVDSSEQNPGYFLTNRDLPKGLMMSDQLDAINQKYGTNLRHVGSLDSGMIEHNNLDHSGNADAGPIGYLGHTIYGDNLLRHPRAGMGPTTRTYSIDTMGMGPGAGANKIYPALYDYILSQPDAANISSALSSRNGFRRTTAMAPAYERYGEDANRIIMNPDQLADAYVSGSSNPTLAHNEMDRVRQFHTLTPDAQVGALNAVITQQAGGEVPRLLNQALRGSRDREPEREIYNGYLARAKGLGLEPDAPWKPTTDMANTGYFQQLGSLLKDIGNTSGAPTLVGPDSLRRAALTSDALDQGLTGADLNTPGQRWLTQGLGRAQGGSVPPARHTPGTPPRRA